MRLNNGDAAAKPARHPTGQANSAEPNLKTPDHQVFFSIEKKK